MCAFGELKHDLVVGDAAEGVPAPLDHLVVGDGERIGLRAYKYALREGDRFVALTGARYPAVARAGCRIDPGHVAPERGCTCGFHAVADDPSSVTFGYARWADVRLHVVLSGRVLVFAADDTLGFRAEQQTVLAADDLPEPTDPRLRAIRARRLGQRPDDAGHAGARLRRRPPTRPDGSIRLPRRGDDLPVVPTPDDDVLVARRLQVLDPGLDHLDRLERVLAVRRDVQVRHAHRAVDLEPLAH